MPYYTSFLTGNSRTIVFQGSFSCPVGYDGFIDTSAPGSGSGAQATRGERHSSAEAIWGDPLGASAFAYIKIFTAISSNVTDFTCVGSDRAATCHGFFQTLLDLGGGNNFNFTSSVTEIARSCWPSVLVNGGEFNVSSNISGTYRIELDVDEWVNFSDFSTPADKPWPPVTADGPLPTRRSYFETVKIGTGVLRVSLNAGALGTFSHQLDNAVANIDVGYFTTLTASAFTFGSGTQSDCSCVCNGTFAGITLSESSSFSGSGSRSAAFEQFIDSSGSIFYEPGTYPWSWSIDASSGASVHSSGANQNRSCTIFSQPRWLINFTGSAKLFDGSTYPNQLMATFYAAGIFETLLFTGSFSHHVERRFYNLISNGVTLDSSTSNSEDLRAWCQLDRITLSLLEEEFTDSRLMGEARSWDAITIKHNPTTLIDDCSSAVGWVAGAHSSVSSSGGTILIPASGGIGSATVTYTPKKFVESYRYLDVKIMSTIGDHVPVTITIGTKHWNIKTDAHGVMSTQTIDLCCPDGISSGSITQQDSRWPIISYTNISTLDNTPQVEASNWGVNCISSIAVSAIPDGETLVIDDMSLSRKSYATLHVASTYSSDSGQGFQTYISPSGPHFIAAKRHVLGNTDGRQSLECMDSFFTEGGYAPVSIDYLATELGRIPGWTVTNLNPSDPYYNNTIQFAYQVGAGGMSVSDSWLQRDATSLVTLKAYSLFDVLSPYPGQNSADGGSDNLANPLNINCTPKILRGSGHGLSLNTSAKPVAGNTVEIRENPPGTVSAGSGISDPGGYFITGLPYSHGNKSNIFVSGGTTIGTGLMINRKKRRISGVVNKAPSGSVHITYSQEQGLNYSVEVDQLAGTIIVRRFCVSTGRDDELDVYITPTNTKLGNAQITFSRSTKMSILFERMNLDPTTHVVLDHNIYKITNWGTGNQDQWSSPVTVAPGKNPVACVHLPSGIEFCATYDTDRWKLYTLMPNMSTYDLVGDVAITPTDDQTAGLQFSPMSSNELIFKYNDSGTVKRITSTNFGRTWGT